MEKGVNTYTHDRVTECGQILLINFKTPGFFRRGRPAGGELNRLVCTGLHAWGWGRKNIIKNRKKGSIVPPRRCICIRPPPPRQMESGRFFHCQSFKFAALAIIVPMLFRGFFRASPPPRTLAPLPPFPHFPPATRSIVWGEGADFFQWVAQMSCGPADSRVQRV